MIAGLILFITGITYGIMGTLLWINYSYRKALNNPDFMIDEIPDDEWDEIVKLFQEGDEVNGNEIN